MKKVELLSPAGNKETLYYAVHAGCDAVYVSTTSYTARKYAKNFTLEELKEAVKYCHLYGVKLYVTVNTIIYEQEVKDFIKYIKYLYECDVDALIMQDLGMIKLVNELFPDFEIHASTQFHTHNEEQVKLLQHLNVKRVVLARELSLQEINNIKTPLEKEIFIHGALCVSYSGQCYFSSKFLQRSGNRGECAGMCRLPYELYEKNNKIKTDGQFLLSSKELCTIENLKDILDSNITSLKIEGRMKKEEYTYYVTKIYKKLIEKYYNHEDMTLEESDLKTLELLYNRKFTKGYLNNNKNNEFINTKSPKHQGIVLGKVLETTKDKIKIKLQEDLNQNDGIRFSNNKGMIANFIYNEKDMLINHANKNQIIYLDNKVNLKEKGIVLKTQDDKLIKDLKNIKEKKIDINYKVIAKINKPLQVTITDGTNTITKTTSIVEQSKNNPTLTQDLSEKLSKIGETPFQVKEIEYDVDKDIFIPLKYINEIRRYLTDELIKERTKSKRKEKIQQEKITIKEIENTNSISFLVRNETQLKTLLTENVNIYIEDEFLYNKYKKENKNIYLKTPRVNPNPKKYQTENILASETGTIYQNKENNNIVSDVYLNVVNSKTINTLENLNVKRVGLSVELNENDLNHLLKGYKEKYKRNPNLELLVYGKLELMIMKYCPLNALINDGKKPCNLCKNSNEYSLKDRNGKKLRLINNNCITKLMDYQEIDYIDKIPKLKELGITNFRVDLLDEGANEIKEILTNIKNVL